MPQTWRATAEEFLGFDEALRMHETLVPLGFELLPRPRVWNQGNHSTVRLVWRQKKTRDSATLALRICRVA
jgi:hypothetical protein